MLAELASPGLGKGLVSVEVKDEVELVEGLLDFLVLPKVRVLEVKEGVMGLLGLPVESLRKVLKSLKVLLEFFLVGLVSPLG